MNIKRITKELGLKYKRDGCPLEAAGIKNPNYKDVELLKEFLTEKGKIVPKRISGLSARSQVKLTAAIKKARNLSLLSYSSGYAGSDDRPKINLFTEAAPRADIEEVIDEVEDTDVEATTDTDADADAEVNSPNKD